MSGATWWCYRAATIVENTSIAMRGVEAASINSLFLKYKLLSPNSPVLLVFQKNTPSFKIMQKRIKISKPHPIHFSKKIVTDLCQTLRCGAEEHISVATSKPPIAVMISPGD